MNRRDFVKHLALIGAGAAALPQQLLAFERLYDTNAPKVDSGIVQINEFSFGFNGVPHDEAIVFTLYGEQDRVLYRTAINTRATFRYVAAPDCPMLTTGAALRWEVKRYGHDANERDLLGTLKYTDQDGKIQTIVLTEHVTALKDVDWATA